MSSASRKRQGAGEPEGQAPPTSTRYARCYVLPAGIVCCKYLYVPWSSSLCRITSCIMQTVAV